MAALPAALSVACAFKVPRESQHEKRDPAYALLVVTQVISPCFTIFPVIFLYQLELDVAWSTHTTTTTITATTRDASNGHGHE